jgi:hypothetical protein
MAQLKRVVDPFGEVNIYPSPSGKARVVATILMEPHKEGAQTGIALDGSGSMRKLYGMDDGGGVVSSIFKKQKTLSNEITPVAQQICAYLARKIDADGGTTCIYWATGEGGGSIEVVGDLTAEQAEHHTFGPPRDFGTGTQLLPAVRYFVDRFRNAPWGFYVFITDGELHDLDAVKEYSTRLAREVAAGRRKPLKFVLIGIGPDINEAQMEELDDLDTGTPIDLWDHKLAAEMRVLQEIFAEVVDKNARVADHGRILDPSGRVIKDYSDTGLPAYLQFEVPNKTPYFTLEVAGQRIHQRLYERAQVPPSEVVAEEEIPTVLPVPKTAPPPIPPVNVAQEQRAWQQSLGAAGVRPAPKQEPAPKKEPAPKQEEDDADALWRLIDLEFAKQEEPHQGVNLEPPPRENH